VTEDEFQYMPEYASEEVRREILELTKESEPRPCAVECCEHLIRHWCEALEDGNPLYLDEDYARSRGFRGLVAQPGMFVSTLTVPFRWPWPPKDHKPERNIHFYLKELLGLPQILPVQPLISGSLGSVRHRPRVRGLFFFAS